MAERLEERRFSLEPWVNEDTRLVQPDRVLQASEIIDDGEAGFATSGTWEARSDGAVLFMTLCWG